MITITYIILYLNIIIYDTNYIVLIQECIIFHCTILCKTSIVYLFIFVLFNWVIPSIQFEMMSLNYNED